MNIGIILAGGSGTRMGNQSKPKQFIDVYGKPLIIYTLEAFENNEYIDEIVISCHKDWIDNVKIWCRKYEITKVKYIVEGGNTRQESSYNALKCLDKELSDDDIVVIHDSARPLITPQIIKNNVIMSKEYDAVDTVIHSDDTVIRSIDDKRIESVPTRKELYLGQTPQSFKYSLIKNAHIEAEKNGIYNATDDCQLVLKLNKQVFLVDGDKLNLKITRSEDLTLFKAILKMGRIGG
ncbi:2-C-methyl-D-erythritol 4-phosphate cytidylyltransferase [Clostridium sp. BJN0001]|uniref:2-C-methyl-D-erythritol 4-phosphate cytidylyltransferase n=1 Tax=Clostridium sp. BJN0001 TaxID=2930219 RepID=UPI001FD1FE9B|nr:2-C-methyl-D-erythritol 4-phosphate cytidylyltransferase [Clostridium sp. BJN0001]